jgi:hypothetical protein
VGEDEGVERLKLTFDQTPLRPVMCITCDRIPFSCDLLIDL